MTLENALRRIAELEAINDVHLEKVDELNEQIGELLNVARDTQNLMPIAFTYHDDAVTRGWTERDEEAWKIITDLYVDLTDLLPAQAPIKPWARPL